MNREIEFRGMRVTDNKWFFGSLLQMKDGKCYILKNDANDFSQETCTQVRPETVGQFCGITDRNGVKVYDGTKCTLFLPRDYQFPRREVQIVFVWKNNGWFMDGFGSLYGNYYFGEVKSEMLEITGNIHEAKEGGV